MKHNNKPYIYKLISKGPINNGKSTDTLITIGPKINGRLPKSCKIIKLVHSEEFEEIRKETMEFLKNNSINPLSIESYSYDLEITRILYKETKS